MKKLHDCPIRWLLTLALLVCFSDLEAHIVSYMQDSLCLQKFQEKLNQNDKLDLWGTTQSVRHWKGTELDRNTEQVKSLSVYNDSFSPEFYTESLPMSAFAALLDLNSLKVDTIRIALKDKPVFHTVTFKDWNDEVLTIEKVKHRGIATAPVASLYQGYSFVGWDTNFDNIISDLVVKAMYKVKHYKVTFIDWNNVALKTETIEFGNTAIAPQIPARKGYTFVYWDAEFNYITEDLVVNAMYELSTYTVIFTDWNEDLLTVEKVKHGGTATAPSHLVREGYTFTGWDTSYENVISDLNIMPLYKINSYVVTFKNWNNEVLKTDEVEHGKAAVAPTGFTRQDYVFKKWGTDFSNVTSNLTVVAQYSVSLAFENPRAVDCYIYPSPVQNTLQIRSDDFSIKKIKIYTTTGYLMLDRCVKNKQQISIDFSSYPSGVYSVRIFRNENEIITKRIIKQ